MIKREETRPKAEMARSVGSVREKGNPEASFLPEMELCCEFQMEIVSPTVSLSRKSQYSNLSDTMWSVESCTVPALASV